MIGKLTPELVLIGLGLAVLVPVVPFSLELLALRRLTTAAFGTLMSSSHRSMREDFEISTPEIDALVRLAQGEAGVFGARLTGGGFGGSIVALASADVAAAAAERIAEDYARRVPQSPTVLIPPR